MFGGLQRKWKVGTTKLLLILFTFAIGGSLTGYVGKKLMSLTDIKNPSIYLPTYIVVVTVLWPLMVLLISLPMGQFYFFKNYITQLGKRIGVVRKPLHINQPHLYRNATLPLEDRQDTLQHIVIFASGAGSNAQNIINYFRKSTVVRIVLIACNKPGAGVLEIARKENIAVLMIEKERFFRGDGYLTELQKAKADLVVLAGFLWKIPSTLISAYTKQIINIHPALLPKYGGKGMYGLSVHDAVLKAGELQSGITIHYVDEHYDQGDVIFQKTCTVLESDTPGDLALRIHQLEHMNYPQVIEKILESGK